MWGASRNAWPVLTEISGCYDWWSTGHFYTSLGNQLSGIAPSQILSVEHYFSDLSDFEFDCR